MAFTFVDIKEQAAPFCCISGKVSDYTTNNAYLRSQMNETEQARYDAAGLFSGMTAEEYQELAKLAKSQKAGEETGTEKKQAVLQALMDRGLRRPGCGRIGGKKYFLNPWTAHGVPKGALIVTDEEGVVKG